MKKIYILSFISFFTYGISFSTGEIEISFSPYTITQPGSYILTKDLTQSKDENCITINTNNVTIDLNGHTLFGQGTGSKLKGSGIVSLSAGPISITNGQVSNFPEDGINIRGTEAHISKLKVTENAHCGIFVDGGIVENNIVSHNGLQGIFSFNIHKPALISGNVVTNNGVVFAGAGAISCYKDSNIINNTLSNNSNCGIFIQDGNCNISGNVITYCYGSSFPFGIFSGNGIMCCDGNNCNITNNTITNCQNYGIFFDWAHGGRIKGNAISQSGINGIQVNDAAQVIDNNVFSNASSGIVVSSGAVSDNNVSNNGLNGVFIEKGNGNVTGNTIMGSRGYGILITGNGNTVKGNTVSQNGSIGIQVPDSSKIVDNSVYSNASGGIVVSNECTISDNDVSGNGGNGIFVQSGDCNVTGNTVTKSLGYGILINEVRDRSRLYESIWFRNPANTRVVNNAVYSNTMGGIAVSGGCTVSGNDISGNKANGILISEGSNNIQNNSIFSNVTGLNIIASGNFWAGNIFRSNSISTSIAVGNTASTSTTGGLGNVIMPVENISIQVQPSKKNEKEPKK